MVDLERLPKMDLRQLQQIHRDLFGDAHPTTNTEHVRRKIAWHLQAQQEGGLPDSARQQAIAIARTAELRVRIGDNAARRRKGIPSVRSATTAVVSSHDQRLPHDGGLLRRDFKGRTIVEYNGRRFRSLSAIAKEITGTKWNGYLFFGLTKENQVAR